MKSEFRGRPPLVTTIKNRAILKSPFVVHLNLIGPSRALPFALLENFILKSGIGRNDF